jgi:drug/metabolite transporter (DMT)-like permease
MTARDLTVLLVLGALWGIAFPFLRIAVPEFGPFALMEVRVLLAAAILVPLVLARRRLPDVLTHWRGIIAIGLLQYAVPFCLLAYALQALSAGYGSVINASAPLFAGLIARLWLGERPDASRATGLALGLAGVALLAWNKLQGAGGQDGLAVIASILAALCYGAAAVLARRHLAGVNPMAVAGGSIATAALVLLPFSIWLWPDSVPSTSAWSIAVALGVLCTAVAFVLYFRLIESVGPSKAITVTFVIPVFGVASGVLFLHETVTTTMIAGGIVVAIGTALATGLVSFHSIWRRGRALATRTAIVFIALAALDDVPGDIHAAEVAAPVYLKASSFSFGRDDGWDSFPTLAISGEIELFPDSGANVLSLFAEYHVSDDSRVDGASFVGVLVGHNYARWDVTGYWFTSRFPDAASRQTVKSRLRRALDDSRKIGVEYLANTDGLDAGELKLGYYRKYRSPLSLKVLAGTTVGSNPEATAQVTLSWQLR